MLEADGLGVEVVQRRRSVGERPVDADDDQHRAVLVDPAPPVPEPLGGVRLRVQPVVAHDLAALRLRVEGLDLPRVEPALPGEVTLERGAVEPRDVERALDVDGALLEERRREPARAALRLAELRPHLLRRHPHEPRREPLGLGQPARADELAPQHRVGQRPADARAGLALVAHVPPRRPQVERVRRLGGAQVTGRHRGRRRVVVLARRRVADVEDAIWRVGYFGRHEPTSAERIRSASACSDGW